MSEAFLKIVRIGLFVVALTIVVFVLLGVCRDFWWGFDLLSHFRLQYLVVLAIVAVCSIVLKARGVTIFAGFFSVLLAGSLLPYLPIKAKHENSVGLKLLSFNVFTSNQNHSQVIDLIRASGPDIIVLYEVDFSWMRSLSALKNEYSTAIEEPRDDNFGIVMLVKGLKVKAEIKNFGLAEVPSVVARVDDSKFTGLLVATHPVPPMGRMRSELRDQQISEIAKFVWDGKPAEAVVVGDLNASPWSRAFRMLTRVGLRDARRGYGISPTWKRSLPWIAIPIDHALVGDFIEVLDFKVLESAGSDHNGILMTFRKTN